MKQKNKSVFCLVDAGNTSIKISLIQGSRETFKRFTLISSALEYLKNIKKNIDTAGLSSVRDSKTTQALAQCLKSISGRFFFARDAALSLFKSRYDLEKLGEDRLCALSYALLKGSAPCVVVDAGTAVTIDFLKSPSLFLGGYICAGFQTECLALFSKTAKLPPLKSFSKIKGNKIPVNTQEAIASGVFRVKSEGIAALITEHLKTIQAPGKPWKVILSGGDALILKNSFKNIKAEIVPEIVLKGLNSLAEMSPAPQTIR